MSKVIEEKDDAKETNAQDTDLKSKNAERDNDGDKIVFDDCECPRCRLKRRDGKWEDTKSSPIPSTSPQSQATRESWYQNWKKRGRRYRANENLEK